jgi:acetolactate synthase-1/2/3 large subunit
VLESEGVDICFGMPGGAILPLYDALARGTTIRHVLVRHEQGAGHMAQGYARASGKVGVVFATSGPGATNLVTPIADAAMDSTPLVCVTGQVRSDTIGSDAFQECDITGITMPIVKHSWLVQDVHELPGIVRAAFQIARRGRPGPVLIDIPRDVQEAALLAPDHDFKLPGYAPPPAPKTAAVRRAAALIANAERPVLYVGGGAQVASDQVIRLAERSGAPVVTTLMGKGAFPEGHHQFVGWPGMHGCRTANLALHHADVIVAAGARFDDRVTGRLDAFAPVAKVVHIDADPYEHGKVRPPDVGIVGDLKEAAARLAAALPPAPRERPAWRRQLAEWAKGHPLRHGEQETLPKPQDVIALMSDIARQVPDVVWTTGVGQHQMWAMQHVAVDLPRSFITSGGHGTMGFGLPAAIGAKAARPQAKVVCIDGDGSFQMTIQELAAAVAADLPVIAVILNNGHLGMVYQRQSMFYERRLSHSDLSSAMPDFATIARGYGAVGVAVDTLGDFEAAFRAAMDGDKLTVIDVTVDPAEACYPMITPGGAAAEQVEWEQATNGRDR